MDSVNHIGRRASAHLGTILEPRRQCFRGAHSIMRIGILAYRLQKRLLMHEKTRQNPSRNSFPEAQSPSPLCGQAISLGYWRVDGLAASPDTDAAS
jgi:hypothetical protein